MSVWAAILVDAENVSGKQYMQDLHQFLQTMCSWCQAQIQEFAVHGDRRTHGWWRHEAYSISYYHHTGGKNAADKQIHQHALTLAEQGVSLFYLVSNDKHLGVVADQLETRGCSVFCLGTRFASRALQRRIDFFRVDQRIVLRRGPTAFSDPLLEGESMSRSYYPSSSTNEVLLTSQERVGQAIQLIYQRATLPDVYSRLLALFLEWATCALSLHDQDVICSPGDIAAVLKEMEQDLLLSSGMNADGRAHWTSTYAFARRCEYACAYGRQEASRLMRRMPHMSIPALRQASLERNSRMWEHVSSLDLPQEQQEFFRFVERAEEVIWQRWYALGMEQEAQVVREKRQKAWSLPPFEVGREADF